MRLRAIIVVVSALLLGGCTTHDKEFSGTAPESLSTPDDVRNTSDRLIAEPGEAIASIPPNELAALTRAAAIQFQATGGAGMRTLTRRYADALLEGRIVVADQTGFYSGARPMKISPSTTLRAGLALAEAYRATRSPRYAAAVRNIARIASREAFGLEKFKGGYVMRTAGLGRRPSIALTALSAAFMADAAPLDDGRSRGFAQGALRTVVRNQAAVGRWYAFIGTRIAMTLEQWGATLSALATIADRDARSVAITGIRAIYDTAFTPKGAVRSVGLTKNQPMGIAIALQALASGPPEPFTGKVFDVAGQRAATQARDGSVRAELALAFATFYGQRHKP